MQTIRRCEEHLARAHQRGLIHGACHTYVGQEAIAAGVCAHLEADDAVFSTHRGHGHALAKGVSPRELAAELFGRRDGLLAGRGGSMHLFAPEVGMMGTSGIVGPCILQAAGAGYSFEAAGIGPRRRRLLRRRRRQQRGLPRGAEHGRDLEAARPVRLREQRVRHRGPVRVLQRQPVASPAGPRPTACPASRSTATTSWPSPRPPARPSTGPERGGGATLIECKTYRTRPHAEGMGDYTYRTREEVEGWKARCPIRRLRRDPRSTTGSPTEAELEADRRGGRGAGRRRDPFAEAGPWPDPPRRPTTSTPSRRATRPRPAARRRAREITVHEGDARSPDRGDGGDPTIFVMGEGIGKRGGNFATTTGLFDRFGPVRLCDTPICERGFVGLAARRGDDGDAAGDRLHVRRLRPRRASARSSTRSPRSST